MPYGTCCAPAVPGVCCPTTCPPGNWSTTTSGFGGVMEPGRGSMTPCFPGSAGSWTPVQSQWGRHRQPEREDQGKRGPRGYDAGKKVKGRKRHIVVDTQGLLLAMAVHPASVPDSDGAKLVWTGSYQGLLVVGAGLLSPFVMSLSNHERAAFDKLRKNGNQGRHGEN